MRNSRTIMILIAALALLPAAPLYAMHIAERILPPQWAGLWFAIAIPFVMAGLKELRRRNIENNYTKPLVGLVGAAVFIISCMPIPVPTAGSCSHPCGTGMAAILIGPSLTVVITSIALLLQALFLAHGGLTSLGADIVSMGVAGAYTGYYVFKAARSIRIPAVIAAFIAGLLSDWVTYTVTSVELASALHNGGSFIKMWIAIGTAFLPTQLPLGIFEGFLCAGAYRFIQARRPELLQPGRSPA